MDTITEMKSRPRPQLGCGGAHGEGQESAVPGMRERLDSNSFRSQQAEG